MSTETEQPPGDTGPDVRTLLAPSQFDRVVHTVLDNNPGLPAELAERIVTEALKFVAAARTFPIVRITPSNVVDEGWHALILHTRVYAGLCDRLGGFVHHYPERPDPERHDADALVRTVALIEEAGYTPDHELWIGRPQELVAVAAQCSHTPVPGGAAPSTPGGAPRTAPAVAVAVAAAARCETANLSPPNVERARRMSEDEAEQAASALRRRGFRAVAVPEDPHSPDGEWRVYDSTDPATRRDLTDEARAAVPGGPDKGGPTRGFVIPARS